MRTDFQSAERVGVMGYMPPEVYACQPYGTAVDIFAFGVILKKLLRKAFALSLIDELRDAWHTALWETLGLPPRHFQ